MLRQCERHDNRPPPHKDEAVAGIESETIFVWPTQTLGGDDLNSARRPEIRLRKQNLSGNSMHSKLISNMPGLTFAVIMEAGDEVMTSLQAFCEQNTILTARFTAIGAFSDLVLGYFDWQRKEYDEIPVSEQVEVLTLAGDVALQNGQPKVHAHVVVGKRDGSAHGGHLLRARVRPTLEVMLTKLPGHLERRLDPESGIPLIKI